MSLHVSSTCAHRQEVRIVLYRLWYHHTETSELCKITKVTTIIKKNYFPMFNFIFILPHVTGIVMIRSFLTHGQKGSNSASYSGGHVVIT